MRNKQAGSPKTLPNLNGNDMYLSGVMGKNLACNDEEQAGWPPQNSPQPKWQWYVSFRGHGEESGM